jgi:hypothetical protein
MPSVAGVLSSVHEFGVTLPGILSSVPGSLPAVFHLLFSVVRFG